MFARSRHERVLDGHGNDPLDALVRQLWLPSVEAGARVVVNPSPDTAWTTVERYTVVPNVARARLLVPAEPPAVTAASLMAYRHLRAPATRLARLGYGVAARARLTSAMASLAVQVPTRLRTTDVELPLRTIARELGRTRLRPAIGVLGVNSKVTLQLFDDRGAPVGYAKTAWNEVTTAFVNAEITALHAVAGGRGRIRVPGAIAVGTWAGRPFVVTAPLPADVRALPDRMAIPAPDALQDLMPVHRHGDILGTAHASDLRRRLDALPVDMHTRPLRLAVDELWALLRQRGATAGIATRWHGDFVPWNLARERNGQLWCWDWESSEEDAVAGLDAMHWYVNELRTGSGPAPHLAGALGAASAHLRAAGTPERHWPDVLALYAVALTERVWSHAAGSEGWDTPRAITRDQLLELLSTARERLT